jgi:hypothetical protein
MSRYSNEERQRILARTAATLQRGEAAEQQRREQEYLEEMRPPADEDTLAEAMAQPLETRNQRDRRELEEQEQRFKREHRHSRRSAEPAPVDLDLRISAAIATERQFMTQVIAEVIAELNERQEKAIADAARPLQAELAQVRAEAAEQRVKICELQLSNGSLREQLAGDHSPTIELPALPLRGSRAN